MAALTLRSVVEDGEEVDEDGDAVEDGKEEQPRLQRVRLKQQPAVRYGASWGEKVSCCVRLVGATRLRSLDQPQDPRPCAGPDLPHYQSP